jgi:hypothetical protein
VGTALELEYPAADAGHGWLIFALAPAQVVVHASAENDTHELYVVRDDVHGFMAEMRAAKTACSSVEEERSRLEREAPLLTSIRTAPPHLL